MADGLDPLPLALIVCDHVHRDDVTHKRTLIGTFSRLVVGQVPYVRGKMGVYAAVTECRGDVRFRVLVVDAAEEQEPIGQAEWVVAGAEPLMVAEFHKNLTDVVFPDYGTYRVQLWGDDAPLSERRIVIVPPGSPP